ncbi:hypothetical protein MRQ36_27730 [Micromonospora sp. R77]|uniref:hypothetical protein n=1 Tax=Micromonospora sp. R77 TaxID=2925836 RepID=UPI001F61527A|nr:hypothetical protein [Micromonospora sp. R77]MCI4066133.1 hypothetical protein [Micromonospora sp. R77]
MTITEGSCGVTVVDMFAGMSRGRKTGSRDRRHRGTEEDGTEPVEVYRESVTRLQTTAYRNVRQTIAYATIFVAVVATWMIFTGDVTPLRLPWYAASILGGALGLCTYVVRDARARLYVLAAALVLTVVGVAGIFLVS